MILENDRVIQGDEDVFVGGIAMKNARQLIGSAVRG
jgi:hypothetical protein